MKPEDLELAKRYPLLLADMLTPSNDPMSTALSRWGLECGPGWRPLLEALFAKLEPEIAALPEAERHRYRAVQIKEKFGSLRVYTDEAATPSMTAAIEEAERASTSICDICSEPGKLRNAEILPIATRCNVHATKCARGEESYAERAMLYATITAGWVSGLFERESDAQLYLQQIPEAERARHKLMALEGLQYPVYLIEDAAGMRFMTPEAALDDIKSHAPTQSDDQCCATIYRFDRDYRPKHAGADEMGSIHHKHIDNEMLSRLQRGEHLAWFGEP